MLSNKSFVTMVTEAQTLGVTPALRRLYTLGEMSYMGATYLHRRSIDSSTFNKIERITGECHL